MLRLSPEQRFWAKVEVGGPHECWLWTASTYRFGYGQFFPARGEWEAAHRFSWIIHNGPIPDGLCVLHHCDVPRCVNPAHLFLGDRGDNARDMIAKRRHWRDRGPCMTRGERNGNALLTEAMVRDIRRRHAADESQVAIAKTVPVCRSMVGNIVRGEAWT